MLKLLIAISLWIFNMSISAKQEDYLINSTANINICSGVTGSGKSFIQIMRWDEYIHFAPDNILLIASARNSETLHDNIIKPWLDLNPNGITLVNQKGRERIKVIGTKKEIALIGADDESAYKRVRGKTTYGWLADEITLQPKSFVEQALATLRFEGKICPAFWGCNPDYPQHFIKTDFIDKGEIKGVKNWYFGFQDNPILTPEWIAYQESLHSGVFKLRLIKGLWVAAEGSIYDTFDFSMHASNIPYSRDQIISFSLGVDWGYTPEHLLAIILIAESSDGVIFALDEISCFGQLVDESLLSNTKLGNWLKDYNIDYFVGDPARPDQIEKFSQITKLQNFGLKDKIVVAGIQVIQRLLIKRGDGKYGLYISELCPKLKTGMSSYRWNPNKKGVDEPLKEKDDEVDALRYNIMADKISVRARYV